MSRGTSHNLYNRARQRALDGLVYQRLSTGEWAWVDTTKQRLREQAERMGALAKKIEGHLTRLVAPYSVTKIAAEGAKHTVTVRIRLPYNSPLLACWPRLGQALMAEFPDVRSFSGALKKDTVTLRLRGWF